MSATAPITDLDRTDPANRASRPTVCMCTGSGPVNHWCCCTVWASPTSGGGR